ncbi:MAG TPA: UPF0175 family protein [bacterium]
MEKTQITFQIPESILHSLNQNREEFTLQTRLLTALQLFKNHKLTFGQATELAGMNREEFLSEVDKYEIDLIDYSASELDEELERFQR